MAQGKLYNLARMTTATTGTGTITLGSAATVSGTLYLSFAQAGVQNGDVVTYAIADTNASEIGTGTYTSSGTTLTRTVIASTNSNTAINLSGSAQVFITPSAADIIPYSSGTWTPTDASGASLTLTSSAAYTVIGNMVFAYAQITYPGTASGASAMLGGLPFNFIAVNYGRQCNLTYSNTSSLAFLLPNNSSATITLANSSGGGIANSAVSNATFILNAIYPLS